MSARLILGCQGWRYAEWVGAFYRGVTSAEAMLREYASNFSTVEVAETFRGIPPLSLVRTWRESVPAGFSFALRVPQQVTHERRLSGTDRFIDRFLKRVTLLGDHLGPLVILMPAGSLANDDSRARFSEFILSLPTEVRWAVEFRSRGWLAPEVLQLLRRRRIAVVWGEGRWLPRSCVLDLTREPTADFAYVRWNPQSRRRLVDADAEDPVESLVSAWSSVLRGIGEPVETVYGYVSNRITGRAHHDLKRIEQAALRLDGGQQETLHSCRTDWGSC